MLPSTQRITRTQFSLLGKPVFVRHSTLCTARIYKIGEKSLSRAMVTVSKKEAKKAVDRNRLRRRYYTSLTPILKSLPLGLGVQIIVKAPSRDVTQKEISHTISTLLL